MHDFAIRVGSQLESMFECTVFTGTVSTSQAVYLPCTSPLQGRFVHIEIGGLDQRLSMCEVEIYGSWVGPSGNIHKWKQVLYYF